MTWAYAANVLDLEPRGPLPTEIYWRRRGLAVGIAVVVIGIVAATVIAFMGHSSGAKPTTADKPNSAQSKPGSPAPQAPPPAGPESPPRGAAGAGPEPRDAHPHRSGAAAAGAEGG
ncbi:putative CONSERVED MEMBRANE domain protein [Mycobacterium intracellulare 1956]|uniref:Putative CONSERVED MEMBRANE domain protein n=1 Tax=Mycobacterium intracellulare 1956 TaxID=1299331 RepID=X8CNQ7_MYCIT|nr:putative CONSERVED MEMBRANE domain protein [Mycobacterium intracellulare 1956]